MSATSTTPAQGTPAIPGQAGYDADQDARIRALRRQGTALGCVLAALIVGAVAYLERSGRMPNLAAPSQLSPAPVVHCPAAPAATCAPTLTCAACPACPAPRSHRRD